MWEQRFPHGPIRTCRTSFSQCISVGLVRMPGRVSPFELPAIVASTDNRADETDRDPPSQVRSVEANEHVRSLVVFTGLSGQDAQAAWVTVSDACGVVYFEGSPAADGTVAVYFDDSRRIDSLRILLETARMHRQAEVALSDRVTEYAFQGVARHPSAARAPR